MKTVIDILEERISSAIADVTGLGGQAAVVSPTADSKFGDYQVNGIMAAAKKMKVNPRQLAEKVLQKIDVADICEKPEIAGPGFINLRIKPDFAAENLLEISEDKNRLGMKETVKPRSAIP